MVFVKGAPDVVLKISDWIIENGKPVSFHEILKEVLAESDLTTGAQGSRCCIQPMDDLLIGVIQSVEKGLTFVGFMMIDPARPEVKAAVKITKGAVFKSVMVTGDYKDMLKLLPERLACVP